MKSNINFKINKEQLDNLAEDIFEDIKDYPCTFKSELEQYAKGIINAFYYVLDFNSYTYLFNIIEEKVENEYDIFIF